MIVRMNKYTMVLYHREQKEFLDRLQALGLVDITATGWEADEKEREMLSDVDKHKQAVAALKEMASADGFVAGEPFADGEEAYGEYCRAAAMVESVKGKLAKANKELEELTVWGEFSIDEMKALEQRGVKMHFFSCYTNEFNANVATWSESSIVEKIAESGSYTYFVVITPSDDATVAIDAQQMKAPTESIGQKRAEIAQLEQQNREAETVLARCAASLEEIEADGRRVAERLQFSKAMHSGTKEADGTLIVLEGWGAEEDAAAIGKVLDESEGVVYIKERPTPEDDTPVKLKNSAFARPFEFIGQLYSLPKYGSLDLTRFFGPFYMLFFGICLGDAGYGLLLLAAGLYILRKMPDKREIGKLTIYCGSMTVLCGFLVGSFFGISLPGLAMFENFKDNFITTDNLFYIALALGGVQLLFAMVLNVVNISIQSGFKYSLGTLGWLLLLASTAAAALLPESLGFTLSSVAYMVVAGVGVVLMLFVNNPDKNPISNFGSGLWNTYNNVIGILGDVLSYIRLFALCLSGGTLALVFNDLAVGMAPDIPVVKQLFVIVILVFGHGINLFMSSIGAFVHPMRLTFVEFYKNSGFEASMRPFVPFKKEENR